MVLYQSGGPGFILAQGRQRGHLWKGRQTAGRRQRHGQIRVPEPPSPVALAEFTPAPWL